MTARRASPPPSRIARPSTSWPTASPLEAPRAHRSAVHDPPLTDVPAELAAAQSDRYRLEREVGRGGMATVFLAYDLRHDRPVALKVLHPELAASIGPGRFLREIRIAARLRHPHILPVHDSGDAAGQLWYTMPFVEGESLRQRLAREGQLPIQQVVRIATQVLGALGYAHANDVVHRDIKPEYILLEGDHAVVADFGVARAFTASDDDRVTETGLALGTPAYMSPEQASGARALDGRSDLYAVGCVIYEMLAGTPPFVGAIAQQLVARHMIDTPPPIRAIRSTVPEWMEGSVLRALAKLPVDRFASAAEFADALSTPNEPALSASVPSTSTPSPNAGEMARPRRSVVLALVVAGIVLGASPDLLAHRANHRYRPPQHDGDSRAPGISYLGERT